MAGDVKGQPRYVLWPNHNTLDPKTVTGHWGTAAVVWAYTEDAQGSNQYASSIDEKSPKLSLSDFAALKIRGLSTRNSVRMTLPEAMKKRDVKAERNGKGSKYCFGSCKTSIDGAAVTRWRQVAEYGLLLVITR